jgi:hypothetical protein
LSPRRTRFPRQWRGLSAPWTRLERKLVIESAYEFRATFGNAPFRLRVRQAKRAKKSERRMPNF